MTAPHSTLFQRESSHSRATSVGCFLEPVQKDIGISTLVNQDKDAETDGLLTTGHPQTLGHSQMGGHSRMGGQPQTDDEPKEDSEFEDFDAYDAAVFSLPDKKDTAGNKNG